MKWMILPLALLALVPVRSALACDSNSPHVTTRCCDPPVRWADRQDLRDSRIAIDTEDGDATLILTDDVVAFQLSDRALKHVNRKLKQKESAVDDEDNPLARSIKAAIFSSVRSLVRHSAECPLTELDDVRYDDGRLIFLTEDGARVFEDIEVNGHDLLDGFSDADAREFVREFRRVKSHS
jgi:hypothetical protein